MGKKKSNPPPPEGPRPTPPPNPPPPYERSPFNKLVEQLVIERLDRIAWLLERIYESTAGDREK